MQTNGQCLYRVIAESGILDRPRMLEVVLFHLPDAPDFRSCEGCCSTSCENYMHESEPHRILTLFELFREGLIEDQSDEEVRRGRAEVRYHLNGQYNAPEVLNPRVRQPQRVYVDLERLSGDPRVDRQVLSQYQHEADLDFLEQSSEAFANSAF
jgi:hypothetical protein